MQLDRDPSENSSTTFCCHFDGIVLLSWTMIFVLKNSQWGVCELCCNKKSPGALSAGVLHPASPHLLPLRKEIWDKPCLKSRKKLFLMPSVTSCVQGLGMWNLAQRYFYEPRSDLYFLLIFVWVQGCSLCLLCFACTHRVFGWAHSCVYS